MSKIVGLILIIIGVIDFFTGIIGCYYWEILYLDNWVPRPFGKCQPLPYLVFIILGATASAVGNILLFLSNELRITAGIIIILFSLQMLGILNFNFLNQDKRIETKGYKDNYVFPVLVGSAFAFGWTPCIGPILGSILALSATEASISKGILLLSFYSIGLAIPFILSGYYMSKFLTTRKGFNKYYGKVTKTGGAILLITGVLIATNQIQVISYYILTILPFLTTLG